jgi:signal transduction histidine kinase
MIKESIYGPITDKQSRASERIMTNSRRLLDIVSDLLDQAQIEAGKLTIHVKPFHPAELIEAAHGLMDKLAFEKGLELVGELDPKLPVTMNGDIVRLQQILVNLVNNAIKYSEQGSIHFRLLLSTPGFWSIEVQDTGEGIPEDDLSNIFEAFRQVDGSATRKHGGFGLGLTIVKQLAELMGGVIEVKSKIGKGSIFTVSLPIIQVRSMSQ